MATTKLIPRKTKPKRGLTTQQRDFVGYLLADPSWNVTGAARKAGYSHPEVSGQQLLKTPHVARLLGYEITQRAKAQSIDAHRVLRELTHVALSNPQELFDDDGPIPIQNLPEDTARAIASIKIRDRLDRRGNVVGRTYEYKLWSKNAALETIAKHLGMLDERLKVEHGLDGSTQDVLSNLLAMVEGRPTNVIDAAFVQAKIEERP